MSFLEGLVWGPGSIKSRTLAPTPSLSSLPSPDRDGRDHRNDVSETVFKSGATPGAGRRPYFTPWPDELVGLGGRTVDFFERCADCREAWSWCRYGGRVLCLPCALHRLDELIGTEKAR